MSHCTLVAHKFVFTISQCTCFGGVDNVLAAVAWIWCGMHSRCVGMSSSKIVDTNVAE